MTLTSKIPFRTMDLNSIESQWKEDTAEPDYWKQKRLFQLDEWIAELTAILDEMRK